MVVVVVNNLQVRPSIHLELFVRLYINFSKELRHVGFSRFDWLNL